jgi:hypothetical protein
MMWWQFAIFLVVLSIAYTGWKWLWGDHEEDMPKRVTKVKELNDPSAEWSDTLELGPGEGKWVTIASWIEDADGTRHPATPEAVAEFERKWDAEMEGDDDH